MANNILMITKAQQKKNKSKGIYSLAFHVSWKNTTMEEAVVFEISQK